MEKLGSFFEIIPSGIRQGFRRSLHILFAAGFLTGCGDNRAEVPKIPISDCGVISQSGEYALAKDIKISPVPFDPTDPTLWGKACVSIESPDVILDCGGKSFVTGDGPIHSRSTPLEVVGDNVIIKNCGFEAPSYDEIIPDDKGIPMQDVRLNGDNISFASNTADAVSVLVRGNNTEVVDNNFSRSTIIAESITDVDISDNRFGTPTNSKFLYEGIRLADVTGANIISNSFLYPTILKSTGTAAIIVNNSNSVIIKKNKIDGGWERSLGYGSPEGSGMDEGILLEGGHGKTHHVKIADNDIENVFDCGVETAGRNEDLDIHDNSFRDTGFCAFGAWYDLHLVRARFEHNTMTRSPGFEPFYGGGGLVFFADRHINSIEPSELAFRDNVFADNQLDGNTIILPQGVPSLWDSVPFPDHSGNVFFNNIIGGTVTCGGPLFNGPPIFDNPLSIGNQFESVTSDCGIK